MSNGPKILRNSLISLAACFAGATAWAASPPASGVKLGDSAPLATRQAAVDQAVSGTARVDEGAAVAGLNLPVQSPTPPKPRIMDLRPPDIREVMSSEQIAAAIPNPDDVEVVGPETVQVRGETPPPYVPSGFAALYWAATHPSSAWRILAPVR